MSRVVNSGRSDGVSKDRAQTSQDSAVFADRDVVLALARDEAGRWSSLLDRLAK
ncbi:hypothetical protein R4282_32370 [Rhodococcus oxybenzonivorans]|uniref:hypothetical protein n=1 Tax=Rhodococcus oxybenzonivorans TaxID=1990687 RepID=UPI0029541F03|nr:hypothetical protein [Rhodococcus oxybenzonivorans]MDV7357690.1 hypothetical protein [Rhodococcus oxybenzonivorans]